MADAEWLPDPEPPLVEARTVPLLVTTSRLDQLREFAEQHGAAYVEADSSQADEAWQVIDALKAVLPFPSWCGSGWDSIDDAYQELRDTWPLPLVLVLRHFDRVLDRRTHAALEVVIRLHEVQQTFEQDGARLIILYEGTSWP